MTIPNVNLGQSQFQDCFFVAGAQLSPYRQLRQIELELRSIEDSLKRASIQERRLRLKLSKLDLEDESQALDAEEITWDLHQQTQMINDAEGRKANFLRLREELLAQVPKEYWDLGYENAECDHWVRVFSQELALMRITGQMNPQTMKQICLMPPEAQQQITMIANQEVLRLQGPAHEVEAITAQTEEVGASSSSKPDLRLVPPSAD